VTHLGEAKAVVEAAFMRLVDGTNPGVKAFTATSTLAKDAAAAVKAAMK